MRDRALLRPAMVPAVVPSVVFAVVLAGVFAAPSFAQAGEAPAEETSCLVCHGDPDYFDDGIVESFHDDIHTEAGLSCHDCHGGNSDSALAEDMFLAKDEGFAENPWVGVPERAALPGFCGRCHSDPAYMRRFRPDLRVDQESEYWTSQHGKALAEGNLRVAVCTDCHAVHGILGAANPVAPVYPTHVAETCRTCHGDPEHMAGAELPNGEPLPTNQYALWRRSYHAQSLLERGDLSAPTCNDCHGNHGAAPPGVESITFVCGQCHSREAELFRSSPKHTGLEVHNEMLADAGPDGCRTCHFPPHPAAELATVRSLAECAICHGNHAVVRATVAILADLPETPCAFCHESSGALAVEIPEPEKTIEHYAAMRASLLAAAEERGLSGIDLWNWLVDQALDLPTHTFLPEGGEHPAPRPEFERLFEKFRIGKTYFEYEVPGTGEAVRTPISRCGRCHGDSEAGAGDSAGLENARQIREKMQELTTLTARAERIVLSARRGGVETHDALVEIDHAVDAQISLEVLVHAFSTDEKSDFDEKHAEGLASARTALEAGRSALEELQQRRIWLAVLLVFIALVAVGLALKIRELSWREPRGEETLTE